MKYIKLTQGKRAIVDNSDFEELNQHKWQYNKYGYASRSTHISGKKGYVVMHRQIMNTPPGMDTDHINRKRLDNRRENLRICTRAENAINSTRPKRGATLLKATGRWMSRITVNGDTKFLGYYSTEAEALGAYNKASAEYHGEFSRLNAT